jgi:hypothetical protein
MRRSDGCEGRFSIGLFQPVSTPSAVTGWGECQLVVKSWNRGRSAVRAFLFRAEEPSATVLVANRRFEPNREWLLKSSISQNRSKKLCARKPYRRLSCFS